MGTLYNLCISSIIFLRTYIHNIVYIIRSVNMFNLCFGFDLAWFGKFVQTRARACVCVCVSVCLRPSTVKASPVWNSWECQRTDKRCCVEASRFVLFMHWKRA